MPVFGFKGSLTGGVLSAVGASVCCVAPLALVALGVGGASVASLTALEPLRPWLTVATLAFLGLAWRRLYVQARECAPGTACADPGVSARQRTIFWLIAAAALVLLSVPWLAPYFL
ncbi:MAG: mercury transporter MerT [Rubrivivax sp.]|nr:mercury transporter MerT [Rubrivivax sp.]